MFEYTSNNEFVISEKVLENGEVIRIKEFHESTKPEDVETSVKYDHKLKNGKIVETRMYEKDTQNLIYIYQYEKNSKFEDRSNRVKFCFSITDGFVSSARRYAENSNEVIALYGYPEKTVYGTHGKKILYRHDYSKSCLIKTVNYSEYPVLSSIIEYYPVPQNEDITKFIKKIINFTEDDRVDFVTVKDENTQEIKFMYRCNELAKLGNYQKNITNQYVFSNGELKREYIYKEGLELSEVIDFVPGVNYNYKTNTYCLSDVNKSLDQLYKRRYVYNEEGYIDYALEQNENKSEKLYFREFSKIENDKLKIIKREEI